MSSSASILSGATLTNPTSFTYPPHYSFPPFFTIQPNPLTRSSQLSSWSSFIQSYCRYHKIYQISPSELSSTSSPLIHNAAINRRLTAPDVKTILEYMSTAEAGKRAEWVDSKTKTKAWIWWRTLDEWADLIYGWIESTAQRGSVLTVWELSQGDGVKGSDLFELDQEIVSKALHVLVKRGRAQVFGEGESKGVKFF